MRVFRDSDRQIIRAFLVRESHQYNWALTGEKGRLAFIRRMLKFLMEYEHSLGHNYAHIQSLTNMGQLEDELVLSTQNFDPRRRIYFYLPPSPSGNIGVSV